MSMKDDYRAYIACLNDRDWLRLGLFVAPDVIHNGRAIGLMGYTEMLAGDVAAIPDLRFAVEMLVGQGDRIAVRLTFDCMPTAGFMGLAVDGRRVRFHEHAFYRYADGRIAEVWSVIDKAAIEEQIQADQ